MYGQYVRRMEIIVLDQPVIFHGCTLVINISHEVNKFMMIVNTWYRNTEAFGCSNPPDEAVGCSNTPNEAVPDEAVGCFNPPDEAVGSGCGSFPRWICTFRINTNIRRSYLTLRLILILVIV